MIDHLKLHVSDLDKSKAFYEAALAPIGYSLIMETAGERAGFGAGFPDFWIAQSDTPTDGARRFPGRDRPTLSTLSMRRRSRRAASTMVAPARVRTIAEYYGAFAFDPDGNNIEACNHGTLFG